MQVQVFEIKRHEDTAQSSSARNYAQISHVILYYYQLYFFFYPRVVSKNEN